MNLIICGMWRGVEKASAAVVENVFAVVGSVYQSGGAPGGGIDAFNEAGFTTAWISNQKHNGSFIDFFGQQADSVVYLSDAFTGNSFRDIE